MTYTGTLMANRKGLPDDFKSMVGREDGDYFVLYDITGKKSIHSWLNQKKSGQCKVLTLFICCSGFVNISLRYHEVKDFEVYSMLELFRKSLGQLYILLNCGSGSACHGSAKMIGILLNLDPQNFLILEIVKTVSQIRIRCLIDPGSGSGIRVEQPG